MHENNKKVFEIDLTTYLPHVPGGFFTDDKEKEMEKLEKLMEKRIRELPKIPTKEELEEKYNNEMEIYKKQTMKEYEKEKQKYKEEYKSIKKSLTIGYRAVTPGWAPPRRPYKPKPPKLITQELIKKNIRRRRENIRNEFEKEREKLEKELEVLERKKEEAERELLKYRFIDASDKVVINVNDIRLVMTPPVGNLEHGAFKISDFGDFSEGLAQVHATGVIFSKEEGTKFKRVNRTGYIDKTGTNVIPPIFLDAKPFCNGLAAVNFIRPDGEILCGFIDKDAVDMNTWQLKFVIPPIYDVVPLHGTDDYRLSSKDRITESRIRNTYEFHDGLAAVSYKGKYGYIDSTGNWVINPQFAEAFGFQEGLACVKGGWVHQWGYINKAGNMVIKHQFFSASSFSDGLAKVKVSEKDDEEGFIDKAGNIVIEPNKDLRVQFYDNFHEGVIAMESLIRGKRFEWRCGYIDTTGNWVISPQFDEVDGFQESYFSEGLAKVKIGKLEKAKYGFINIAGNVVIDPQFTDATKFSEGLASVQLKKQKKWIWGYIDKSGKMVINPQFAEAKAFHDGLARVKI
ncbi:MAG: WG repeat-containing protein [Promethearchaeota archaeon]